MTSLGLVKKVGISPVNISRIERGRLKGVRFSALTALHETFRCKPGDITDWMDDDEHIEAFGELPESK